MSTLQFLLLEDKLQDTAAIAAVLTDGGIDCELLWVDTRADFVRALETAEFDLLLVAYAMPGFEGIAALETARNLRPETPFIFVSASLGEELAIEALKQGATDYVLKQRLERLVPCVQRALREAQERRDRQRAEAALRQNEARLRAVAANLPNAAVFLVDTNLRYVLAEGKALAGAGMTTEDLVGKTLWSALDPVLANRYEPYFRQALGGEPFSLEHSSHERHYISHGTPLYNDQGEVDAVLVVSYDISDRKQADAAQREGEERYRTLFESIDEGFCTIEVLFDADGKPFDHRILQANPAFERQSGLYNPEGKTASELAPGVEQYWNDLYAQVIHTGESIRTEIHSDAFERWFDVLVSPVGDGATRQVAVVFTDISDRKQIEVALQRTSAELERQVRKFNATLSTLTDSVFTFDRESRFLYANQVLLNLWGITAAEAIGKTMAQLNYPAAVERQVLDDLQRVFETGQTVKNETPYTNPAGVEGYFEYILSPVFAADSTVESVVGSSRDISERKAAEVEREQLLQQEQSARAAAEQANRLKDEFLAVLSHELRSPLNPILGWARLLQTSKLDAARQAEALRIIERNAKLQAQLIEDLLDISGIMQGKLSFTAAPVNLEFVMLAALETVQLAAQAKHIKILLDLDTAISSVLGDAGRLQQAVWNLLTNAIKFTPTGGQVIVELQQVDGLAQIRVSDTGKGISSQFLPHVFEYFRQEDGSTTRKFGGLGLGLAIARQIVELHGGTIAAHSPGVGQGTTFTVLIPLAPQSSATSVLKQLSEPAFDLSGMKILVVDDEADSRELISFVLEQENALVTTTSSGSEALQVIERSIPDLVISDIGMPEMDGYMLMRQIRTMLQSNQFPAIALTAYAGEIDRKQAEAAGFQLHLAKPVEPAQLLEAISNLITNNQ